VAVSYWTCFRDVHGINFDRGAGYPVDIFRGFPQSLRSNSGIVLQFGHKGFIRNPFKSMIHHTSSIIRAWV
jgi:hypothetical protein